MGEVFVLDRLLLHQEPKTLEKYTGSIETLLKQRYGSALNRIFPLQTDTVPKLQFVLLMTLNQEPSLRDHFQNTAPPNRCLKLPGFFRAVQAATDRLLNFQLTRDEYVQHCIEAWIIS